MQPFPIDENFYFNLLCITQGISGEESNLICLDNKKHNISYAYLYNCNENDNVWKLLCNCTKRVIYYLDKYMIKYNYNWRSLYFDRIKYNNNVFRAYMTWLEWRYYLENMKGRGDIIPVEYIGIIRTHTVIVAGYDPDLGLTLVKSCINLIIDGTKDNVLSEMYALLLGITKLGLSNPSAIINNIINALKNHTEQAYDVLLETSSIICTNNFHYPSLYYLYRTFINEFDLKGGSQWLSHICDVLDRINNKCENPLIICQILFYGLPISLGNEKKLNTCCSETKDKLYTYLNSARESQFAKMK